MNPNQREERISVETLVANRRHDDQNHLVSMDPKARFRSRKIDTAVRGPLTDKLIAKYRKMGYYSSSFRAARRELWKSKLKKISPQENREGNFLISQDGSRIYSPL